ncbi:MAG: hypothetical protein ACP5K2_10040 [bacterium]
MSVFKAYDIRGIYGKELTDELIYKIGLAFGKYFENFETIGIWEPDMIPVNELIVEYWKKVGIRTTLKQIDPTLWRQRGREANQLQASVLWGAHDMGWQLSYGLDFATVLWDQWYNTGGKQGEEPPLWYKTLKDLAHKTKRAALPGSSEYNEVNRKIRELEYKYIPAIYITEKVKYPLIASAKLGNVPTSGYAIAANFSVEQFFFRK